MSTISFITPARLLGDFLKSKMLARRVAHTSRRRLRGCVRPLYQRCTHAKDRHACATRRFRHCCLKRLIMIGGPMTRATESSAGPPFANGVHGSGTLPNVGCQPALVNTRRFVLFGSAM